MNRQNVLSKKSETTRMDRRRVRSRSGLHRGLQSATSTTTASQASSRDEPASSGTSSRASVRGSQKLSNSEILRRSSKSAASNLTENNNSGNIERNMPESPTRVLRNSKSDLPMKSRKRIANPIISDDDESDEGSSTNRKKSPTKESTLSNQGKKAESESKRKKSVPNLSDNSENDDDEDRPATRKSPRNKAPNTPQKKSQLSSPAKKSSKNVSNSDEAAGKDSSPRSSKSPGKKTPSPAKKKDSELSGRAKKSITPVSESEDDSDDCPLMSRKSPVKESNSTLKQKQKKSPDNSRETEKENVAEVATFDKVPDEKLLRKRKKFAAPVSDSDSDQEPVAKKKSPLKLQTLDPRLSKPTQETEKSSEQNRASQVSRLSLSSRHLSLKRPATQRESNTSKLKKLASPVKTMEQEQEEETASPDKTASGNKLEAFLRKSGVTLTQEDGPYQLDEDAPTVEKKMIQLLSSKKFTKEEIIRLWRVFIDDENNLKKALNDVTIANNDQLAARAGSNVSLIRMFLQIPVIQTEVSDHLLQKLNEAILAADCMDDVPWSSLLLQQFRFLETVTDTDSLTLRLEELLETCPIWFQRELVLFLPDIVIDVQHHAIAEMLSKLLDTHVDLTNVVLECITNLTLGKEYLEEFRDKVLTMLKTNLDVGRIPAMAKFVLNECPTSEICQKTLTVLRSLELQPLRGEKSDEYYTCQSLLVNAMKMSILLSKGMSSAATVVVKNTDKPPKPLDLVIVLLVYTDMQKKKIAESVLKQHVKTGFYRASLLTSLYQDYQEVARDLQPEALQLASNLLKSEDRVYVDFAIEWFRHQFVSQAKATYKQREIIEKIILLMGNNDQTAKGALEILRRLTESDEEKAYLQSHCHHLRILLEKIDNFDLQEVATLSDLLYALCTSSNGSSEALQDDLFILMQKQLSNAKTVNKCKGVLGAAMAIKHLAGKPESCKIAEEIFEKVGAGTKHCPRSKALFYDQIGRVIADTKNIEQEFLKGLTEKFQDEFVDTYLTDLNDYKGELESKFGLNDHDNEPQKCVINFGDGKNGSVIPALFRLLRICYMRLHNGDLEEINMLLGCPVLLPKDMEIPEACTMDLMICCINWFRELINGFVTQSDAVMQEQILKRLEDLMTLQAEFSTMLSLCEARYQPPPCYFHLFPAPAFVKVEKKITKKGKRASMDKSAGLPEWEAWEIGASLCSKNPAYFRQMDAKVVDLLDLKMDKELTQSPKNISKAQVCFLIRELLGMFEAGEAPESLMRDLIHLLPKICSKLQDVVAELRDREDTKNRQAAKLILTLLTTIFDWKGFKSAMYHAMLRDGLRTLAGQIEKSNSMLRSSKQLVEESYKYFESLADIATEISVAFALVKMCRTLMKHSDTFTRQCKEKQAKMACGFLSLQWPDDRSTTSAYKAAVVGLLANWIQNEPDPLDTVTAVMDWLPDEAARLSKPQDRLERLPTITKANFHHMFQRLFEGLINGAKISSAAATSDPARIKVWYQVGQNVQQIVQICKNSSRSVLLPFLRSMTSLVKLFISSGMPILEANLRYQPEEVTGILKMIQSGTRYLNVVCVDTTEKKDMTLGKLIPSAKQASERLLFLVKGMLVANNIPQAFWMGNLVNKNCEGQQILSQSSDETSAVASGDEENNDEVLSDVLQSDVESESSDDDDDS